MLNVRSLALITSLAATVLPLPVFAQQPAPAAGLVATTNNPNLAVATVKLENGTRTSKLIGSSVYSDANEKLGTLDDVILTDGNRATVAIVAVGGVMGVGSKLVALPYETLRREPDKIVLSGATKDSLAGMPSFTY